MTEAAAHIPALYWALVAFGLVIGSAAIAVLLIIGFKFQIVRWGWDGGKGVAPDGDLEDVRGDIDRLRERQSELRENLPLEYVRIKTMEKLEKTWSDLAKELHSFMNSCREGNCPGQKHGG